ncbi:unnamed protein product [Arabis nemorensis]|uniref:Uncharacterized protein n=1 Tax=Arabis nemorensis TaxID=586526 RepID=A0A565CIC4_9BRAS|nr:unnamed protein product [Arabis nemorensis]
MGSGGWLLPGGRHSITVLLKNALPQDMTLDSSSSDDFKWRNTQHGTPTDFFCLKDMVDFESSRANSFLVQVCLVPVEHPKTVFHLIYSWKVL